MHGVTPVILSPFLANLFGKEKNRNATHQHLQHIRAYWYRILFYIKRWLSYT